MKVFFCIFTAFEIDRGHGRKEENRDKNVRELGFKFFTPHLKTSKCVRKLIWTILSAFLKR